jgi:putative phosphoribosyl transferase
MDEGDPNAVEIGSLGLKALLGIPAEAKGLVIFAHGSGSGRLSPRNNYVADALREAGFATLLLDLLTPEEEHDQAKIFDIPLLASRLVEATRWAAAQRQTRHLRIGYFGASTGAGAALVAAANGQIGAVVSRGGRPDLAGEALARVRAQTLLVVGGLDGPVIELNREAAARLNAHNEIVIIPGAGHLFEQAGTLDQVVQHATDWFLRYLAGQQEGGRHVAA